MNLRFINIKNKYKNLSFASYLEAEAISIETDSKSVHEAINNPGPPPPWRINVICADVVNPLSNI